MSCHLRQISKLFTKTYKNLSEQNKFNYYILSLSGRGMGGGGLIKMKVHYSAKNLQSYLQLLGIKQTYLVHALIQNFFLKS